MVPPVVVARRFRGYEMTDREKINAAIARREKTSWVGKMKRDVHAYLKKRKAKKPKFETARTKQTTTQLRDSGLSNADVARLRGGS